MKAGVGLRQGYLLGGPHVVPLDFGALHGGPSQCMGRCWLRAFPRHRDGVACRLGRRHVSVQHVQGRPRGDAYCAKRTSLAGDWYPFSQRKMPSNLGQLCAEGTATVGRVAGHQAQVLGGFPHVNNLLEGAQPAPVSFRGAQLVRRHRVWVLGEERAGRSPNDAAAHVPPRPKSLAASR